MSVSAIFLYKHFSKTSEFWGLITFAFQICPFLPVCKSASERLPHILEVTVHSPNRLCHFLFCLSGPGVQYLVRRADCQITCASSFLPLQRSDVICLQDWCMCDAKARERCWVLYLIILCLSTLRRSLALHLELTCSVSTSWLESPGKSVSAPLLLGTCIATPIDQGACDLRSVCRFSGLSRKYSNLLSHFPSPLVCFL